MKTQRYFSVSREDNHKKKSGIGDILELQLNPFQLSVSEKRGENPFHRTMRDGTGPFSIRCHHRNGDVP